MSAPISDLARALLGRLVRSLGPWRVEGVRDRDRTAMVELVAAGLVEVVRGIYQLTAVGRATAADP